MANTSPHGLPVAASRQVTRRCQGAASTLASNLASDGETIFFYFLARTFFEGGPKQSAFCMTAPTE